LTAGAEDRICRCRKLRHCWSDLRFLPLRSTHLWRALVEVLRGRADSWRAIKWLSAPSRSLEVVVCVPVLLLVLRLSSCIHTQAHGPHLGRQVVHILVAGVRGLSMSCRLRWKVAFLWHWRIVLRRCTGVLIRRLANRRAASLLITRRTSCDRWPPLVWLVFSSSVVRVGVARAWSLIHGEVGYLRGAGPRRLGLRRGKSQYGSSS
jgi:hypothetical protein